MMPAYLDCNATAPLEPEVRDIVRLYMEEEYGNAGSRTHLFGHRAKDAVQKARRQVADIVAADIDEVIFTSGATESLNLAILGLRDAMLASGRCHIVTTTVEHKAVLEPIEELQKTGIEVSFVSPDSKCLINPAELLQAIRPDTFLVAIMQANNETGVHQPIDEIASQMADCDAYFLVDAAQGYGKSLGPLRNPRVDLIAISGHKIYGPKGVGALVTRKRGHNRPPLKPLMFGGGQERGLRPGTLPVALIAGLGLATELASKNHVARSKIVSQIRSDALKAFADLPFYINGDSDHTLPHVLNIGIGGLDSETAMVALKDVAAVSNGSACTSHNYKPSHVLKAMGQSDEDAEQAIRFSWSHLGPRPDWQEIASCLSGLI